MHGRDTAPYPISAVVCLHSLPPRIGNYSLADSISRRHKVKTVCGFLCESRNLKTHAYECDRRALNERYAHTVPFLLPTSLTDRVREHFSQYGPLSDVIVMMDSMSGRSRGFGFITFMNEADATKAIDAGSHLIDGSKVDAKKAVPRNSAPPAMQVRVLRQSASPIVHVCLVSCSPFFPRARILSLARAHTNPYCTIPQFSYLIWRTSRRTLFFYGVTRSSEAAAVRIVVVAVGRNGNHQGKFAQTRSFVEDCRRAPQRSVSRNTFPVTARCVSVCVRVRVCVHE
jgi:hypothetical protein